MASYLPDEDKSAANRIFQSIVAAQKYKQGTPTRIAIDRGYRESQKILSIAATAACVPNIFLMWFMKNIKLDQEDIKDEQGVERTIAKIEEKTAEERRNSISTNSK